ncbi:KR-domain-containing protein [Aspergillus japonicus CBS 114.51]|uniref:KR-domain-containing protein n=1 Tax=Aspergillus japonicus CBS 114.51 TaxID=1448312 RepID=A0A8T8WT31_ASPJA|nr:KR-domain-containing protein [Aspergillus japonicus CBS 114.51]RAH78840.1 KR-domain-containing protein [Aspergillus japonicus CBS 114.51]
MVLRSKVFSNTTYRDWTEAAACKAAGSWNLHRLLPRGMDFFILYSSISGSLGGTATVNYSAACAYQDALAHYRNAIGERTTTLNLGVMLDDGALRDRDNVRMALMGTGYLLGITQQEMFALLEYHCDPTVTSSIPTTPLRSQVVVGINTPRNLIAQGIEVPSMMHRPLFGGSWNIPDANAVSTNDDRPPEIVDRLIECKSLDQAAAVISDCLMQRLSTALGVPLQNLDVGRLLNVYGVDSLMAVELRNWFKLKLDADVAVFEILGNVTFREIVRLVAGKSSMVATMLTNGAA